jgi:hypothetical protein
MTISTMITAATAYQMRRSLKSIGLSSPSADSNSSRDAVGVPQTPLFQWHLHYWNLVAATAVIVSAAAAPRSSPAAAAPASPARSPSIVAAMHQCYDESQARPSGQGFVARIEFRARDSGACCHVGHDPRTTAAGLACRFTQATAHRATVTVLNYRNIGAPVTPGGLRSGGDLGSAEKPRVGA